MITYHDWVNALRELEIQPHVPLLVHASPELTYESRGGAKTTLTALLAVFDNILLPTYTHKTMVTPAEGPENNGMIYSTREDNSQAEVFNPEMLPDSELGKLSQLLLDLPDGRRSNHPVLSFAGIGLDSALAAQTLDDPFGPIRILTDLDGWVLLLGEDQRHNAAIHHAEKLAGRKQFIRWALTREGVVECRFMPGCSAGFNAAGIALAGYCREIVLGDYQLQAYPIGPLIQVVSNMIRQDPTRLLCSDQNCLLCNTVRNSLAV